MPENKKYYGQYKNLYDEYKSKGGEPFEDDDETWRRNIATNSNYAKNTIEMLSDYVDTDWITDSESVDESISKFRQGLGLRMYDAPKQEDYADDTFLWNENGNEGKTAKQKYEADKAQYDADYADYKAQLPKYESNFTEDELSVANERARQFTERDDEESLMSASQGVLTGAFRRAMPWNWGMTQQELLAQDLEEESERNTRRTRYFDNVKKSIQDLYAKEKGVNIDNESVLNALTLQEIDNLKADADKAAEQANFASDCFDAAFGSWKPENKYFQTEEEKQIGYLKQAGKYFFDRTKDTYEQAWLDEGVGGFWQGLWNGVTNLNELVFGIPEAQATDTMTELFKKVFVSGEELSPAEEVTLGAYMEYAKAMALRAGTTSIGSDAGMSAGMSLQFMGTMAVSGGISGALMKGANKVVAKAIAKGMAKKLGCNAEFVEKVVGRYLSKGTNWNDIRKKASAIEGSLPRIGTELAIDAAELTELTGRVVWGGAVQTAVAPSTFTHAYMDCQDHVSFDENGRVFLEDAKKETFLKAWWGQVAFGDDFWETASERRGGEVMTKGLRLLFGGTPMARKMAAWTGYISNMKNIAGKTVRGFKQMSDFMSVPVTLTKKMGMHDMPEEMLEEGFSAIGQYISSEHTEEDWQQLVDFCDTENLETLVLSFSTMPIIGSAASAYKYGQARKLYKQSYEQANAELNEILGNNGKAALDNILSLDVSEMGQAIHNIVSGYDNLSYKDRATMGIVLLQAAQAKINRDRYLASEEALDNEQRQLQKGYRENVAEPMENDQRNKINEGLKDMLQSAGADVSTQNMNALVNYAMTKGIDLEEFVNTQLDAESIKDLEIGNLERYIKESISSIPVIEGTRTAVKVSDADGNTGMIISVDDKGTSAVVRMDNGKTVIAQMNSLTQVFRIDDVDEHAERQASDMIDAYGNNERYRKGDIFNVTKSFKAKEKANGEVEMQEVEGGTKRLADYSNGVFTFEDGSSITEEQLEEDAGMMLPLWNVGQDVMVDKDGNKYHIEDRQIHNSNISFGQSFHGDGYVVMVEDKNGNTTEKVMSADELFHIVATSSGEQKRLGTSKLSDSLNQLLTQEERNEALNPSKQEQTQQQGGEEVQRASAPQANEVIMTEVGGEPKMLTFLRADGDSYVYKDSDENEISFDAVSDRDTIVAGRNAYQAQMEYEQTPEGQVEKEAKNAIAKAKVVGDAAQEVTAETIPAINNLNVSIENAQKRVDKLEKEINASYDYNNASAVKKREAKITEYETLKKQIPFLEQVKDKVWELNGWNAQEVRNSIEEKAKAEESKKTEEKKQAEEKKAQAEKAKTDADVMAENAIASSKGDVAKAKKRAEGTKAAREKELTALQDKLAKAEEKVDLTDSKTTDAVEEIEKAIEDKQKEIANWDKVVKNLEAKMPKAETTVEAETKSEPKVEPKVETKAESKESRKKTTETKETKAETKTETKAEPKAENTESTPEPKKPEKKVEPKTETTKPTPPTNDGKPKKEVKPIAKPTSKVETQKGNTSSNPTDGARQLGESLMATKKAWEVSEWDFTEKGNKRPVLRGVYHEEGKLVSADGHILSAVKGEYDKSLEGKVTDKGGLPIEGNYPPYKSVIPDVNDSKHAYEKKTITPKQLAIIAKAAKSMKVVADNDERGVCIKVGNYSYFNADLLLKAAKQANKHGLDTYMSDDGARELVFHGENGDVIVMPYHVNDAFYVDAETGETNISIDGMSVSFGSTLTSAKKAMIATSAFIDSLPEDKLKKAIGNTTEYYEAWRERILNKLDAMAYDEDSFKGKEAKRLADKMRNLPEGDMPSSFFGGGAIADFEENVKEGEKSGKTQDMQELNDIMFGAVALDSSIKMPTTSGKSKTKDNSADRFKVSQPVEGVLFKDDTDESIAHAVKLGNSLGTEVLVVNDVSELPSSERQAIKAINDGIDVNAWLSSDGKVYIYKPTFDKYGTNKEQMQALVFHEIVAHKGIPAMMTEAQAKAFYHMVWNNMTNEEKANMLAYVADTRDSSAYEQALATPISQRTAEQKAEIESFQRHAADEFVAHMAEQVSDKENEVKSSIQKRWDAVVKYLQNLLAKLYGERVFVSDVQIQRAILASKKNLENKREEARDEKGNEEMAEANSKFSIVPNGSLKDRLTEELVNGKEYTLQEVKDMLAEDKELPKGYVTMYRGVRIIDGKVYSPKMTKLGGLGNEIKMNQIEQSDERPDLAYPVTLKDGSIKYKIDLDGSDPSDGGRRERNTKEVDYNPYIHVSDSMMNDQFSAAYDMPEMGIIKVRVPLSEFKGEYHADKAAEPVGIRPWKKGTLDTKLPEELQRTVALTRYDMPVEIVSEQEVIDHITQKLKGNNISAPFNLFTPQVVAGLKSNGVDILDEPYGIGKGKSAKEYKDKWAKQKAEIEANDNTRFSIASKVDDTTKNDFKSQLEDVGFSKNEAEFHAENMTKFSKVWHGTGADFDKFDSSHIGEGEGAQVHGYGHYVAVDKDRVAKYSFNKRQTGRIKSPEYQKISKLDSERNEIYSRFHANKQKWVDGDEQRLKEIDSEIKKLEEQYNESTPAVLYQVEIPDNDGTNYLEEYNGIPKQVRTKIADVISSTMKEEDLLKEQHGPNWLPNGLNTLTNVIANKYLSGDEIYRKLIDAFGNPNVVNKILTDAGLVGIHYEGMRDGECYVIFNDNDLEITEKTRFSVRKPRRSQEEIKAEKESKRIEHIKDLLTMNDKLKDFIVDVASLSQKPDLNLLTRTTVDDIRAMLNSGLTPIDIKRQGVLLEKKAKAFRSLANQLIKAIEGKDGYDITKADLKEAVSLATKAVGKPSLANMQDCANKLFDSIQDIIYGSTNKTLEKMAKKDYTLKDGKPSESISTYAYNANKTILDNLPKSINDKSTATIASIDAQIDECDRKIGILTDMLNNGKLSYMDYVYDPYTKKNEVREISFSGIGNLSAEENAKAELEEYKAKMDGLQIAKGLHEAEAYKDEAVNAVKDAPKNDVNAYGTRRAIMQNAILLQNEVKDQWKNLISDGKSNKNDRGIGTNKIRKSIQEALSAAFSDMQGVEMAGAGAPTSLGSGKHTFLGGPLRSLDYLLDKVAPGALSGTGQLRGIIHRLWDKARTQELIRRDMIQETLLNKAKEIFGNDELKMEDIYLQDGNDAKYADGSKVTYWNDYFGQEYPLTIGQLAMIYAWSKQEDAVGKLANNHIFIGNIPEKPHADVAEEDLTEEQKMEQASWERQVKHGVVLEDMLKGLPKEWKDWMDYLQDDFLQAHRKEYNVVFKQRYGHDMPNIKHYFPFAIDKNAYDHKFDGLDPEQVQKAFNQIATAEIHRTVNNNPFDIVNHSAMQLFSHHINQTERVFNYNEITEVFKALLSNKYVANKMKGVEEHLYDDFKEAARVALSFGVGNSKQVDFAESVGQKILRNIASTRIKFRSWTALKQLQSVLIYVEEMSNPDFRDEFLHIWGKDRMIYGLKWAMDNIPELKERWESKNAGDATIDKALLNNGKTWRNKQRYVNPLMRYIAGRSYKPVTGKEYGMFLNASFDRLACALGASAMYRAKLLEFKRAGVVTQEQIDNGTIPSSVHDAAVRAAQHIFNKSQQSSEKMYLSPIQASNTMMAKGATMFMNASLAYHRILKQSIDDIKKARAESKKGVDIYVKSAEQMVKQEANELGITDETAIAEMVKNRAEYLKSRQYTKLLGTVLSIVSWEHLGTIATGASVLYPAFIGMFGGGGDDDDNKKLDESQKRAIENERNMAEEEQSKRMWKSEGKALANSIGALLLNGVSYGNTIKSLLLSALEQAYEGEIKPDDMYESFITDLSGVSMPLEAGAQNIRRATKAMKDKSGWGMLYSIVDFALEATGNFDLDVFSDIGASVLMCINKRGDVTLEDIGYALELMLQMPRSARDELMFNKRNGETISDVIDRALLQDYYDERAGRRGAYRDIKRSTADKIVGFNPIQASTKEPDVITPNADGTYNLFEYPDLTRNKEAAVLLNLEADGRKKQQQYNEATKPTVTGKDKMKDTEGIQGWNWDVSPTHRTSLYYY